MGIRDDEIKKLEHYARGLGIKVTWTQYKRGSDVGASWVSDGSEIIICVRPRESKTAIILKFLHELAHHMAYVYSGRVGDFKTDQALNAEDDRSPNDPILPKEQRKLIYIAERDDAQYRDQIYHEVGIKIPKYIFLADKALDIWIYYRYYLTGHFPTYRSIKKKKKELLKKYKEQYGDTVG